MVSLSLPFVSGMSAEPACGGELSEFVSHHVLGDVDRYEFVSVMNCNSVSHEIG